MAKHGTPVRERFSDDAKGLAHWVGRKLNNHHPMRDRIGTVIAHGKSRSMLMFAGGTDQKTVIYSLKDGRQFAITVEEIMPTEQPAWAERGVEQFEHA